MLTSVYNRLIRDTRLMNVEVRFVIHPPLIHLLIGSLFGRFLDAACPGSGGYRPMSTCTSTGCAHGVVCSGELPASSTRRTRPQRFMLRAGIGPAHYTWELTGSFPKGAACQVYRDLNTPSIAREGRVVRACPRPAFNSFSKTLNSEASSVSADG
ncbi:hypothetical protein BD626DRAFT_30934 [Schizophyllum amplum]|uniref:Uncharacterized protein n=1 Tax=Schizophyllum amplum TaxID=97359 RepID=A0A550D0N2_9AGAR|nr:hypothetical protein BD626DRAFT_30934 [Auriculariopsis ampla]